MSRFDNITITHWIEMVDEWFAGNYRLTDRSGITCRDHVIRGVDAWAIAHRSGITQEAYSDRTVTDGHIVTALKKIFPNAVFLDTYSY